MTRKSLLLSAPLPLAAAPVFAQAECPIKVGVLHSLSGTMAISETTLKDTVEMLSPSRTKRAVFWAASSRPL
jgi:urea transport system substrate-binding protein